GGAIAVSVGSLTLASGSSLGTIALGSGNAGNVAITANGPVTIDISVGALRSIFDGIGSVSLGPGNAGNITVAAKTLTITNNGLISSMTTAAGNGGNVSVAVSYMLSINGVGSVPGFGTGIFPGSVPG